MTLNEAVEEDNLIADLRKKIADQQRAISMLQRHAKVCEHERANRNNITVHEFCARNNMSRQMFYNLLNNEDGPLVPKPFKLVNNKGEPVMKKSFISLKQEAQWRKDANRWKEYTYDMSHTKPAMA